MSATLSIVISIFGLVGCGYAAARIGLLSRTVGEGLTEFVFRVAIPLLIFDTLGSADMRGLSPWRIWIAYFIPFAIVWTLAHVAVRRLFGRDARAGVVAGGSAAYANSVLIGLPLMQAAFGDAGTVYLLVIASIHLPIMMLVSMVLNEWALQVDRVAVAAEPRLQVLRRLGVALATHPILIAIAAGVAWGLTGLQLAGPPAAIIDGLGRAAGPLALFASGMALVDYGMGRQIRPALLISACKLLLLPALVHVAARLAGLPPLGVAAATLTAACPTGVNAFLVATQLGTGQALASNALVFSTAGSVVTVALWLTLLQAFLG